jgi:hypothetical protein
MDKYIGSFFKDMKSDIKTQMATCTSLLLRLEALERLVEETKTSISIEQYFRTGGKEFLETMLDDDTEFEIAGPYPKVYLVNGEYYTREALGYCTFDAEAERELDIDIFYIESINNEANSMTIALDKGELGRYRLSLNLISMSGVWQCGDDIVKMEEDDTIKVIDSTYLDNYSMSWFND